MLATIIRYMTAFSLLAAAGCSQMDTSDRDGQVASNWTALTADADESLPQSPIRRAFEAYRRGDFGLAERNFRAAIEHNPREAKAWIGLAASYDQLRRFDLADRAYGRAIKLTGETAQILNNQGYSLLLRGDLKAAQGKFAKANQLHPGDATVANNLKLIESGEVEIPH
jgi:Flp pilus assembly protein TadD